MKNYITVLLLAISPFLVSAQGPSESYIKKREHVDGQVSLGIRSTGSFFGNGNYSGLGYGGQFRIRVGDRLNTEWYSDYIKTDIKGLGYRETAHIGWSVMFYPFNTTTKKGSIAPYILAGHCFDYARINSNLHLEPNTKIYVKDFKERWTSAVQLGIGTSVHLSDRLDLSLGAQYMSHLGNDIHVEIKDYEDGSGSYMYIDDDQNSLTLEGHLLVTFSLNYMIFDFINPKS